MVALWGLIVDMQYFLFVSHVLHFSIARLSIFCVICIRVL